MDQGNSNAARALIDAARRFGKPLLYLHGDGHTWIHDQPFPAPNLTRVQVDAGGLAPPITVTVTHNPETPFLFDRHLPPDPAAAPTPP